MRKIARTLAVAAATALLCLTPHGADAATYTSGTITAQWSTGLTLRGPAGSTSWEVAQQTPCTVQGLGTMPWNECRGQVRPGASTGGVSVYSSCGILSCSLKVSAVSFRR